MKYQYAYLTNVVLNFKDALFGTLHINFKETRSVTMIIFREKYFLFKSFVKIEFSCVFTINMFSTAEICFNS